MTSVWKQKIKPMITIVCPIILMPLLFVNPSPISSCAYVALLMVTFWITEAIPLPITSLLPLVLFPLTGIMTSREVSKSYFVEVLWFVIGALIQVVAIEDTGLHKRIALKVLLLLGTNHRRLVLSFMLITCLISMWITNTATVAMILPIANAVVSAIKENAKKESENKACVDATIYTNKDVVVTNISSVTQMEESTSSEYEEVSSVSTSVLELDDDLDKLERGIFIGIFYATNIGGSASLIGSPVNVIIAEQFQSAFPNAPQLLTFGNWIAFGLPFTVIQFCFACFWISYLHLGFRCRCTGSYSETNNSTKTLIKREYEKLGPMKWGEGSVLFVFVTSILLWYFLKPGLFVGFEVFFLPNHVGYGTLSIGMTIVLFVLPSERPAFINCFKDSDIASESKEYRPILEWKKVQSKFPWGLLFLVGGGFALVDGAQQSGLAGWFGQNLQFSEGVPSWAISLILIIVVSIITEPITTSTVVILFVPILSQLAVAAKIHPLYLVLAPILASPLSYMLPVSAASNALLYSYGKVSVADLFKTGIVLKIFGIFNLFFVVNGIADSLFNFSEFPDWALPVEMNSTANLTDFMFTN